MVGSGSFSARDDPQPGVTCARDIGFRIWGSEAYQEGRAALPLEAREVSEDASADILVIDDPLVVRTARSWRGIVACAPSHGRGA